LFLLCLIIMVGYCINALDMIYDKPVLHFSIEIILLCFWFMLFYIFVHAMGISIWYHVSWRSRAHSFETIEFCVGLKLRWCSLERWKYAFSDARKEVAWKTIPTTSHRRSGVEYRPMALIAVDLIEYYLNTVASFWIAFSSCCVWFFFAIPVVPHWHTVFRSNVISVVYAVRACMVLILQRFLCFYLFKEV